jgi:peptidoglycan/xylan/chitin deacetylase (PgdA/CDA1 family)
MYHGVRRGSHRINGRHITAEQFEKQLQYFRKTFSIVSLKTICEMKASQVVPEKHTIALTFDDGFVNNLTVALPLLEKHEIPATFFICTASISDTAYIHPTDRIDLIRVSSSPGMVNIGGEEFFRKGYQMVNAHNEHAYHCLNRLTFDQWLHVNKMMASQLNDRAIEPYSEVYALMNDQHVSQLNQSNVATLGSHSHYHVGYLSLSAEEAVLQLKGSKALLEIYGKEVDAIAFPFGYYDASVIAEAKMQGYRYLIAGGHVDSPFDRDVYPRVGILDGAGFSYTMLMISNAFNRFGF